MEGARCAGMLLRFREASGMSVIRAHCWGGGGVGGSKQPKIKLDLVASDVMVQITEVHSTSPLSPT